MAFICNINRIQPLPPSQEYGGHPATFMAHIRGCGTHTIKATPTFLLIFSYILHPSSSSFIFPFTIGMNYTQASSWKMLAPHSTHTLDSQLFGESIKTVLYIYHKLSLLPRHFPHLKLEQPQNTGGIDRLCVRTSETSSVVPRWCEQVCYICTYNLTIRDDKG